MRAIDLAVQAGRKRQSPRTGFVHYYPGLEGLCDTIPVFENFCMAFALFRLKTTESVTEGKEIIERLLAFQTDDGNFPVYLHDFPKCWDFNLGAKIGPILIHILQDFGTVLNVVYKEKLENAIKKISQKKKALAPDDWFEQIITDQLQKKGTFIPFPITEDCRPFWERTNSKKEESHKSTRLSTFSQKRMGFMGACSKITSTSSMQRFSIPSPHQ